MIFIYRAVKLNFTYLFHHLNKIIYIYFVILRDVNSRADEILLTISVNRENPIFEALAVLISSDTLGCSLL